MSTVLWVHRKWKSTVIIGLPLVRLKDYLIILLSCHLFLHLEKIYVLELFKFLSTPHPSTHSTTLLPRIVKGIIDPILCQLCTVCLKNRYRILTENKYSSTNSLAEQEYGFKIGEVKRTECWNVEKRIQDIQIFEIKKWNICVMR